MEYMIQIIYFIVAALFIFGLIRMSSPHTAHAGIVWAGLGMIGAILVTFYTPNLRNLELILLAIIIGSALTYITVKGVALIDMPQMIALYNGMGGGAAAAIAAVELVKPNQHALAVYLLAVSGGWIGAVSFSGSLIAFCKLQGWMKRAYYFPQQHIVNLLLLAAAVIIAALLATAEISIGMIMLLFVLALCFGVLMTMPIGGADMPVVISLYNALTGMAVAFEGFVLNNPAMIIAGTVVGAAGILLTQLMAKAMNRPLLHVLFKAADKRPAEDETPADKNLKPIDPQDAGIMMACAHKLIIVPGYGMAVAQAQHKIWELARQLDERGVSVQFAIHPVAGRMPGHMNVLLAEAGVPYEKIFDLNEINAEFENTDVALVIGANDVVNPIARNQPDSPIYGMPILNADKARQVIVIKRGKGMGFSGVDNALYYRDTTHMLFGDGQAMVSELVQAVKNYS